MTKVFIVSVPAQDITVPPAILGILAACCESISADYQIFDLNLHMYKTLSQSVATELATDFLNNTFRNSANQNSYDTVCDDMLQAIQKYQPTHIAISVFTYASILSTFRLLIKLQQIKCSAKIVLGGLGLYDKVEPVTGREEFGEFCLSSHLADYCIYGEGDISFIELLKNNTEYPGINQKNSIQIKDLNHIVTPSYKQIDPAAYFHSGNPAVILTGSRGCVRDCTFCDVANYWPKYIFKSGERIAQEMFDIWQTTGINQFTFSDSLINGSIKSFRELNRCLIKFKKQHVDFNPKYSGQFICRPPGQLREQDYVEIAEAGGDTLIVGIESFSENVRSHMKKHFDNKSIDWHFEMCAKYHIKNVLLLLSGYVTETLDDHATTLEYLHRYQAYALSRTIYAINMSITGLEVSMDTQLHHRKDELGIVYLPDLDSSKYWISMSNIGLTPRERLRRAVETITTAYDLGYKVLHFNQKVDIALQSFEKIKTEVEPKIFKLVPIELYHN